MGNVIVLSNFILCHLPSLTKTIETHKNVPKKYLTCLDIPKFSHPLNSILHQASSPMPHSVDQDEASKLAMNTE